MDLFPGQIHYTAAELNLNNVVVAPVTVVSSPIMPALALAPFRSVELWITKVAGTTVTTAVDVLVSFDGVNLVGTGLTVASAITTGIGNTAYLFMDNTNSVAVGGATMSTNGRFAFFSPFIRLDLRNQDAANSGTFTVELFFQR